ncbi:hypothetical protein NE237_002583 [Protea cynaroides]|uniref:Uncharacterized protein n=1 Tax=Protea cynaroides TaxID=273540 RepID=A0A9Q0KVJ0_9MAGN|nr:hypothetical protein NE237_002583 [Protea cynaroides]
MIWCWDLVDIQQFQEGLNIIYICLADSEIDQVMKLFSCSLRTVVQNRSFGLQSLSPFFLALLYSLRFEILVNVLVPKDFIIAGTNSRISKLIIVIITLFGVVFLNISTYSMWRFFFPKLRGKFTEIFTSDARFYCCWHLKCSAPTIFSKLSRKRNEKLPLFALSKSREFSANFLGQLLSTR